MWLNILKGIQVYKLHQKAISWDFVYEGMMSKIYVNHQIFCWWPSQGCFNLWLSLPGYKTCIVSGSWSALHCKPHILNCILQYYQYMCVVTIMCDMCLKCCCYDSMATATATMTNSMVIGKHNCPTSLDVGYFRYEWPSHISTAVFGSPTS